VKRDRKLIAEKGHSFSGYAGTVTRAVKSAPMFLGNIRANGVPTLAAWCLGRDTFFMERSADNSIILYWQHDGPNSRRKPPPMTADELMTTAQAATLKRLAQAAYELDAFKPNLTRTEADIRIAMLTAKLKLLDGPPHTL
jgi:hypothetical protein